MKVRKFSKPFKHVLIENFLSKKDAKILLKELKKEKFELKESDLFNFKQTQELHFSKNKAILNFYKFFSGREFRKQVEEILRIKLNGKIDMAGSLYEKTDFLLPHDDRLESRKAAYIYYLIGLNKKDGGDLAFFSSKKGKPWKIVKRFFPKENSLILFEVSKNSWHAVEEVLTSKKRYSFTGWFHR